MKKFHGTHFEIGCQIGQYYSGLGVKPSVVIRPDLLAQQVEFYGKFAPEILLELRGIAEGGNYPFEQIAHEALVNEILYFRSLPARSCSIGGFTDNKGQPWVARNYDWHPLAAEQFQAWRFDLPHVIVHAVSDMGVSSPEDRDKAEQRFFYHDAINSHGLFIGLTYAHCWSTDIGLTTSDAVKLVSWRCQTVDEALLLLRDTKLSCPKNFFLADSAGNMAVVEHAVEDMHIRFPDEHGVLVLTNHYAEPLTALDRVLNDRGDRSTSFERYSKLSADLRALKQSKCEVNFTVLDEIMTNPHSPVCQFLPEIEVETVWTLLLKPADYAYRLIRNPRSAERSEQEIIFG